MKVLRRALLAFLLALIATAIVLVGSERFRVARVEDLREHAAPMKMAWLSHLAAAQDSSGAQMPSAWTCYGDGHTPALQWSDAPAGTRSYVVVVRDDDVPDPMFPIATFTHWLLYNIPLARNQIDEDVSAQQIKEAGMTVGRNSDQASGYFPPCPPMGRHEYIFSVYAIDLEHIDPKTADAVDVYEAIRGHVLGYGELRGALSAR
jgi:Raf kinase inhibitor-like YbhB/YbcL family protein